MKSGIYFPLFLYKKAPHQNKSDTGQAMIKKFTFNLLI